MPRGLVETHNEILNEREKKEVGKLSTDGKKSRLLGLYQAKFKQIKNLNLEYNNRIQELKDEKGKLSEEIKDLQEKLKIANDRIKDLERSHEGIDNLQLEIKAIQKNYLDEINEFKVKIADLIREKEDILDQARQKEMDEVIGKLDILLDEQMKISGTLSNSDAASLRNREEVDNNRDEIEKTNLELEKTKLEIEKTKLEVVKATSPKKDTSSKSVIREFVRDKFIVEDGKNITYSELKPVYEAWLLDKEYLGPSVRSKTDFSMLFKDAGFTVVNKAGTMMLKGFSRK